MEKRLQKSANDWVGLKDKWPSFCYTLVSTLPGLSEAALSLAKTSSLDSFVKFAAVEKGMLRDEVYRKVCKAMAKFQG